MDFNKQIDRRGTYCTQWDYVFDRFGEADLLPFTISDTDFSLPIEVTTKLIDRMSHPIFGYTRWNHADFKNSVKHWYKRRFNTDISGDDIVYSPSVMYSISKLIGILKGKDTGIIVQTPAYDAFYKVIEQNDCKIVENPLNYSEGKYTIDFADLETKLKCDHHRILLLCSPHNPTGRVFTCEELEKIVQLCRRYNVYLISDEIHMDILRMGQVHHPIVQFLKTNVAIVTSGSKTFNFPGLVFSYAIIPDEAIKNAFLTALKNQDGLSSASTLGMLATMEAYLKCGDYVDFLIQHLDHNINLATQFLKEKRPEITVVTSESTYLMWLDVSKLNIPMKTLQKTLVHSGKVAIMDGEVYGQAGKDFLRFNVGCSVVKMQDGLTRLIRCIDEILEKRKI